jgi:hypothetical protein
MTRIIEHRQDAGAGSGQRASRTEAQAQLMLWDEYIAANAGPADRFAT